MKKIMILLTIVLLWGCQNEEPKEGACVYYKYYDLDNEIEYCRIEKETACDSEDETFQGEETTCQDEGYTKGCGSGKFVAEDDEC